MPIKNNGAGFFDGITMLAIRRAGIHKNTPAHQVISIKPSTTSATKDPIARIGTIICAAIPENHNGLFKTFLNFSELAPFTPKFGCFT